MPREMQTQPTLSDWQSLYAEAERFRKQASGDVLGEEDIFSVEMPETREAFYCTLDPAALANGLVAHRGTRGLISAVLMQTDGFEGDESILEQDCLLFALGERRMTFPGDRVVQAALGLKFRGKQAWPIFRSLRPSYLPAELDGQEVRCLTTVLEQTRLLAEGLIAGHPLPYIGEDEEVLVARRYVGGSWQTTTLPFPPVPQPIELEADQQHIRPVLRSCKRSRATWESTLVALSTIDDGHEPPYFARMLLCVDAKSGVILPSDILTPGDNLQDALLQTIEAVGSIPKTIALTSPYLEARLAPLADVLGVALRQEVEIPMAEEARYALSDAFGPGPRY